MSLGMLWGLLKNNELSTIFTVLGNERLLIETDELLIYFVHIILNVGVKMVEGLYRYSCL